MIPQEYIVDDQDGIKDPIGMSGVRLEVKVHIVTGSIASAQNIVKCCYLAGLSVDDLDPRTAGLSRMPPSPTKRRRSAWPSST